MSRLLLCRDDQEILRLKSLISYGEEMYADLEDDNGYLKREISRDLKELLRQKRQYIGAALYGGAWLCLCSGPNLGVVIDNVRPEDERRVREWGYLPVEEIKQRLENQKIITYRLIAVVY